MNQLVNFFWTILCFAAVVIYWIDADAMACLYIFIAVSLITAFIPASIFQLSNTPGFYERVGIKQIRKFVQNGDYVNRLIRKRSNEKPAIKDKATAAKYLKTVVMYERYHFVCLVFFLFTTVHAVFKGYYILAGLILISNFIYNVCPILLQQYNRARIARLSNRTPSF